MRGFGFVRSLGILASSLALALSGCSAFKPYESVTSGPSAAVKMSTNIGELGVIVFKPDANCKFKFMGRTPVKVREASPTIHMPPGRAYFRVSPHLPNVVINLEDVSFVLEEGQEYLIEFKRLGSSASWRGIKMEYEFNYLNTSGEFPVPVTVDHFSVCEREQASN